MNLQEIKEHYENFQVWLSSLKEIEDKNWFAPISEGKWSPAAIISHLLSWDRHSFNERFPLFESDAVLAGFPDFQEVNNAAKDYAHSGVSKEQLISEIMEERVKYFHLIEQYKEEDLNTSFSIGNHSLTLEEYFKDFIGHDLHHQKQIIEAI